MSKEAFHYTVVLLLIMLGSGAIAFTWAKDSALNRRFHDNFKRIEQRLEEIEKSRWSIYDHQSYSREVRHGDSILQERLRGIFTRLRLIEHHMNVNPVSGNIGDGNENTLKSKQNKD